MRAIAAMSKNRVIGNGSSIPWRIPDEFKWFRRMTLNGVVIMGRRTFESLPKPLEKRVNVVLTRHPRQALADERLQAQLKHAVVDTAARSLHDDLRLSFPETPGTQVRLVRGMESLTQPGITDRAWLCGGAQIYRQFLPRCSELYLSVVDREVEGDTLFPPFEHLFELAGTVADFPDFRVLRYVRKAVRRSAGLAPRARRWTANVGVKAA